MRQVLPAVHLLLLEHFPHSRVVQQVLAVPTLVVAMAAMDFKHFAD
jgi:hypothetical protein